MKYYRLYTLLCFVATIAGVFLPFIQEDKYVYHSGNGLFGFLNRTSELVANDVVSTGLDLWPIYMPLISLMGLCFLLSLHSSVLTAVFNGVLGVLFLVFIGGVYWLFSDVKEDLKFLIGFDVPFFSGFLFLFLSIGNLRELLRKNRKQLAKTSGILDQSMEE